MWSLGVILYQLITGSPPFTGANNLELLSNIKSMEFDLTCIFLFILASIWEDIDSKCRDLICKLLRPSKTRLNYGKVITHPWLLQFTKLKTDRKSNRLNSSHSGESRMTSSA